MSDNMLGCFHSGNANAQESVCIHTSKIFDSCRDKDCVENMRFYPTECSQAAIDRASTIRSGEAELLHVELVVNPISFNKGYFTIDVRYFYHVTADAFVGAARPIEIHGLSVFDKRVILYGGESNTKTFSSADGLCISESDLQSQPKPRAVVEAVDPVVLGVKLVESCDCCDNENCINEVPTCIYNCFGSDLIFSRECRRVYITIGQFSIIRMERDTQLIMPAFDYCMPTKDCPGGANGCDNPCDIFSQIQFPTEDFFPSGSLAAARCAAANSNMISCPEEKEDEVFCCSCKKCGEKSGCSCKS